MKKFLLLYTAPTEVREQMQNATPEEMKEGMNAWVEWFKQVGDNIVDKGMPLGNAMTVTKEGEMPGNVKFVAYTVIQAEDLDGALKAAKMSPHLEREGATVEVHEMMPMPGME
ncbi:MAG TPA: hypothetical protein VEW42_05785 [Candidatus Eisenbacteria bacterium]|nr:hypothetical protein [Candidatus Eisenbacteria bacterium]